jgi:uncharacterized membrane protein
MKSVRLDPANALCGLLFIGLGLFFTYQSFQLELGTAFRMGPGYFPLVLAIILSLLGIVILVQATRVAPELIGAVAWRGMLFILPAPVVFGLLVRGAGFVPALFVAAFIASFASERLRVPAALLLATGITFFSVLVFSYGLGLPFERFGPWLRF